MGRSLAPEALLSLAVTVTSEQHVESVLQSIVQGLASQPGVAMARIWLLPSADLRGMGHAVSEPPENLSLVASAGTPINSPGEDWGFLHGHFARVPLNVGKVGQVAANRHPILVRDVTIQNEWVVRPEWAKREEISSFAGYPLMSREKLLGVIGIFSRQPLDLQEFTWLGLFASQAAIAIADASAEEALRASERNLAAIINTIPTTAWTTRPDGYCDFLNQVWLDYAGMTLQQAEGRGWLEAIHPDDRKKLAEEWQSCLASGTPVDTEARIRRFDNSYRWFLIRANPLKDESGNILKLYGTCTDIQGRKRAEEELRNAQSELARVMRVMTMGQLTACIAHEVNQPLSGIITNANTCLRMLDANPPNLEGARETVRRTIRDGHRATDVITRLRTLYSKKEPAVESIDLNETAREVTALSSTDMQRNGVTLRQDFAEDLPPALGDRVQLQQVISNLLRNAVDAMSTIDDRPRELLVRTERDQGNQVRLSVKDSGVGLTPQAADKIFQAFYTTKSDGMGIGLSISRSIIEAHQGRLWASRNDGPGSTFSFSIPCRSEGLG